MGYFFILLYGSVLPPFWLFMILTTSCPCCESLRISLSPTPPSNPPFRSLSCLFRLLSKTRRRKEKPPRPTEARQQAICFLFMGCGGGGKKGGEKLLSNKKGAKPGAACPKATPEPPQTLAAGSPPPTADAKTPLEDFCAKCSPFEGSGEFILIFSHFWATAGSNVFRSLLADTAAVTDAGAQGRRGGGGRRRHTHTHKR